MERLLATLSVVLVFFYDIDSNKSKQKVKNKNFLSRTEGNIFHSLLLGKSQSHGHKILASFTTCIIDHGYLNLDSNRWLQCKTALLI